MNSEKRLMWINCSEKARNFYNFTEKLETIKKAH